MLQFLKNALASGEHALQAIGPGGVVVQAINHDSFLAALIAYATKAVEVESPVAGATLSALETLEGLSSAPAAAVSGVETAVSAVESLVTDAKQVPVEPVETTTAPTPETIAAVQAYLASQAANVKTAPEVATDATFHATA